MTDIPDDGLVVWRDYAVLLCAARIIKQRANGHAGFALIAAGKIYDNADPSALTGLDAIKRVMEIDTDVTNPATVLWRAGIEQLDMAKKAAP